MFFCLYHPRDYWKLLENTAHDLTTTWGAVDHLNEILVAWMI